MADGVQAPARGRASFLQNNFIRMVAKQQMQEIGQQYLDFLNQSGFTPNAIRARFGLAPLPQGGQGYPQQYGPISPVQQAQIQDIEELRAQVKELTNMFKVILTQLGILKPETAKPEVKVLADNKTTQQAVEAKTQPVVEDKTVTKDQMDARFNAADVNGDKTVTLDEYKEYYAARVARETGKTFDKNDAELAKIYKEAENVFNAIAEIDAATGELTLSKDRFDKIVKYYDSKDGEADGKINESSIVKDIDAVKGKGGTITTATGKSLEEVLKNIVA
ncbi:hypothetical protein IJS77_01085 [bacterium]|nr:hypothetical protein [bacterium]